MDITTSSQLPPSFISQVKYPLGCVLMVSAIGLGLISFVTLGAQLQGLWLTIGYSVPSVAAAGGFFSGLLSGLLIHSAEKENKQRELTLDPTALPTKQPSPSQTPPGNETPLPAGSSTPPSTPSPNKAHTDANPPNTNTTLEQGPPPLAPVGDLNSHELTQNGESQNSASNSTDDSTDTSTPQVPPFETQANNPSVSGSGPSTEEINQGSSSTPAPNVKTLEGSFKPAPFRAWVLEPSKKLLLQEKDSIQAVLEATVIDAALSSDGKVNLTLIQKEFDYLDTTDHAYQWDDKINTATHNSLDLFGYEDEGEFYLNAAHPEHPGGGYREGGSVLEETQYCTFTQLPQAHFIAEQQKQLPFLQTTRLINKVFIPTPYAALNLKATHKFSGKLYGKWIQTPPATILSSIKKITPEDQKNVHLLGIAAINMNMRGFYKLEDLHYLLTAAMRAFENAKLAQVHLEKNKAPVIHTTKWGCGVFGNSVNMMITIQLLAAAIVGGVTLKFHGLSTKGDYSQKGIDDLIKIVQQNQSSATLLNWMILQQKTKLGFFSLSPWLPAPPNNLLH